jgi:endonuclease YncB( thermonuclease family)
MVLGALLSPGHAQVGTETGVVSAVIDGDTLRLADGRSLRLAGIIAPKGDEPFADVARSALARMVLGRRVALAFAQRRLDRHGRLLAQVWLTGADAAPQDWVQGRLLGDGLTRVATTADQREMAAEMLRIEAAARFARRGLWADPAYSVRTADGAAGDLDSFQIFEGRPLAAAVRRGRGYLNFGPDYRTDFTLGFDADALRLLEESDIALQSFEGVRLRVRGWVRWFNGPFIDVTHPEQIEVLE